MRFRTVLLDLDGTLVDHFRAIQRCHAHALRELGLREPSPAETRRAVGRGLENAVRQLLGPDHQHHLAEALRHYRAHWQEILLEDVALLPGARELLEGLRLRGSQAAVLTNKDGPSARKICAHLGLTPLLDAVFGANDTPWLKPRRELTEHALSAIGGRFGSALMIGDSVYDVQTARNAGLKSWVVTTGTHDAGELELAEADGIFPDLPRLNMHLFASDEHPPAG